MISLEYFAFIMVIVTGFISSIGILHIFGFWSYVWRWIKYEPPHQRKWYDDQARIAAAMVKRERKNAKRLELESIFREVHCDWNKPPGCTCLKYAEAQRCENACGD